MGKKIDLALNEKIDDAQLDAVINSKDYILKTLGSQYIRLSRSCDMKWEQAMTAENDGSTDANVGRHSKKENTNLKEYNQQVNALANIGMRLVAIQKSDFKTIEEERVSEVEEDEELV